MFYLLLLAAFFAVFVVYVWRMSAGPSNQEPGIGNNLPGPSNEWGQIGPLARMGGRPALGTPESLESADPDAALRRMHHREEFDEERQD